MKTGGKLTFRGVFGVSQEEESEGVHRNAPYDLPQFHRPFGLPIVMLVGDDKPYTQLPFDMLVVLDHCRQRQGLKGLWRMVETPKGS